MVITFVIDVRLSRAYVLAPFRKFEPVEDGYDTKLSGKRPGLAL